MIVKEIEAKSILRKHKRVDSWFLSCYGMNLYRGCSHDCVYCDGRAEKYQVDGDFGKQVVVKTNAIELLNRELDPRRKRVPFKKCYLMIGGGVGDGYQPVEEKYQLTRKALEVALKFSFPVSVLTKSTMVERDLDILDQIRQKSGALINFSFSSTDEKISGIFEPGVPSPKKRLQTIEKFKNAGFICGMFLMPVIPFITDKPEVMEQTIKHARDAGVDFIIFSGLTLKDGRQRQYFNNVIEKRFPDLSEGYNKIYRGNQWGQASSSYYHSIHQTFWELISAYKIYPRMPLFLYRNLLNENDLVAVMLDHIDYVLKLMGRTSPYGYAAYSVSQLKQPLSTFKDDLRKIKGVGDATEKLIKEIIQTKSCGLYDQIFKHFD